VGEGPRRPLAFELHADGGGLGDADPDEDRALSSQLAENDDRAALPVKGREFPRRL
jgi:hypothetical protein